jgi:hypothetical protein
MPVPIGDFALFAPPWNSAIVLRGACGFAPDMK